MGVVKAILKWIGIIFAIMIGIGVFAAISTKGGSGGGSSSPVSSSPAKEQFEITAQQLAADYESNEVAADERMKGRIIKVSGTVQAIDKDFADNSVIELWTKNEYMPVRLTLKDTEKAKAMSLNKRDKVIISCELMRRIMGSPMGSDCTVN